MRTLATQVRLRRLIRVHGEYMERLAAAPSDGQLAQLARARLGQLADDARRAWLADLSASESAPGQALLDRHVMRSIKAIDSVLAELSRPAGDRDWLAERFRETAVPLLLFLRGLEDAPAELVGEWPAAKRLAEIA